MAVGIEGSGGTPYAWISADGGATFVDSALSAGLDADNLVTQAADYGLSLRFPLADVRLVEYCLAVPTDLKRRNGVGRLLLRRAMERLLPEVIRLRSNKCVFGPDYLLRVQADLDRIRRAAERFRMGAALSRYVSLDCFEQTIDRVSEAGLETPNVAWDCLGTLLPAYYLGRFLESTLRTGRPESSKGPV